METLETKPVKQTTYCRSKADDFFKTFPVEKVEAYKDYWESVAPQTDGDIFRRYLFAYCSVHTSWQGNCRGYNAIKNYEEFAAYLIAWKDQDPQVKKLLKMTAEELRHGQV